MGFEPPTIFLDVVLKENSPLLTTVSHTGRLTQPIGAEIEGNLKLLELQLENVEGGKMEVHGFGPLNWLAGRKVSDLVQETLLQEVEQELRQGLEDQLDQLSI